MTWVGRFIAAAIALVLIATSVMPLVAQARAGESNPHVHATRSVDVADHGHDHDDPDTGDLVHHVQSHAQGVTTASPGGSGVILFGSEIRFDGGDDGAPGGREGTPPLEPPRS